MQESGSGNSTPLCNLSTEGQIEGTSPQDQREKIKNECKKLGYELIKIYSDDGFSGKTIEFRPGLQQLIGDAKSGQFDCLMFTKLDRLGRNLRELLNVWQLITEDLAIELYCIDQPEVNSGGKFQKVMLAILGMFAEWERDLIMERTHGGRMTKWKEGTAVIGSLPYCYKRELDAEGKPTNKIIVDEEQKTVYEQIVSMYLDENLAMADIAIRLTSEGIPTPSKKATRWNDMTIHNLLKNPSYTGKVHHNKATYKMAHGGKNGQRYIRSIKQLKPKDEWIEILFPPIITEERWKAIQRKIAANKSKPRKYHKDYEEHFMGENVLFCGECGAKMTKILHKRDKHNRQDRLLYACYWKKAHKKQLDKTGRKKCSLKMINANEYDEIIWNRVTAILANPQAFAREWFADLNFEELKSKVKRLKRQYADQEKVLSRAYDLISKTKSEKLRDKHMVKYERDEQLLQKIEHQLLKAQTELDAVRHKSDRLAEFERAMRTSNRHKRISNVFKTEAELRAFLDDLPFKEKKRILEAVIGPENGGKVIVRWQMAGDFLDQEELREIPKSERWKPLTDREPMLETEFFLDIDKIQALISGLNKTELSNKNGIRHLGRTGPGNIDHQLGIGDQAFSILSRVSAPVFEVVKKTGRIKINPLP